MDFLAVLMAFVFYIQAGIVKIFSLEALILGAIMIFQILNALIHLIYGDTNSSCNKLLGQTNAGKSDNKDDELSQVLKMLSPRDKDDISNDYWYTPPYFGVILDLIPLALTYFLPQHQSLVFLQFVIAFRFSMMILYCINGYKYVRRFNQLSKDIKIKIRYW